MMGWLWRGFLLWLGVAAMLAAGVARADTNVVLTQSFAGNMNFTGTQVTMRSKSNNADPCAVYPSSTTLSAQLSGLPADATVVSAQLYWAGSNGTAKPDYTVSFEGKDVTAPAARQYSSASIGAGHNYFGGAVDVTAQVAAKGNGSYSFSGLEITNGKPYCSDQSVLGGFALLVVYSSPSETFRVLNLYEGFQYFRNGGITLNLSNFRVPDSLDDNKVTGRLAHITWEGDPTLQKSGEELLLNKTEMTDKLNPAGNQFNSASNINNDAASYGIDFDAYTITKKSGLIKPGQTTATTLYQSGQDLVLLNAEIIGMPNAPTSDLSLTMNRDGELQAGRNTNYNLVVRNAGPSVADGPITVVDTLPDGLNYVSASGSGWSCTAVAQKVTCSSAGPLAVGAVLPTLTLTVKASKAGTYVNTATVSGPTFDNVLPNNTSTDSGTALAVGAISYAFTSIECKTGDPVGSTACPRFAGPVTAGLKTPANIYLTTVTVDSKGVLVASPFNLIGDTTALVNFSLTCDPATRTKGAAYGIVPGGLNLNCSSNSAPDWGNQVSLTFPTGKVSLPASFTWEDVGNVTLSVKDSLGKIAFTAFVVRPASLQFKAVLRTRDGAPLPSATDATGFVRAGEAFTLAVGATTSSDSSDNWAPGFGTELNSTLGSLIKLVLDDGTDPPDFDSDSGNGLTLTANGTVSGTKFALNRLGVLKLKPVLIDYLGTGEVSGVVQAIGRFYPDHFGTTTEAVFGCVKNMACPASVNGAAYSGQQFPVNVTAFGVNGALKDFAGTITLEAYDRPGGDLRNPGGILIGQPLAPGEVIAEVGKAIQKKVSFSLAFPFNGSDSHANKWTRPTPVYLRASMKLDVVKDGTGTIEKDHLVTSKEGAVDDPDDAPAEGGIMVVHGRLQLTNAFGSELLNLPVRMNAQYWTGTLWDNNSADSISTIRGDCKTLSSDCKILFSDCKKALVKDGKCNLGLLKPAEAPGTLKDGAGTILLAAPGRGNTGSALLEVVDLDNLPWLPSTRARAVFGIYKSPLIYIREVY
jgi:uncharacterized repeat protein (TIGR01451 family)